MEPLVVMFPIKWKCLKEKKRREIERVEARGGWGGESEEEPHEWCVYRIPRAAFPSIL